MDKTVETRLRYKLNVKEKVSRTQGAGEKSGKVPIYTPPKFWRRIKKHDQ